MNVLNRNINIIKMMSLKDFIFDYLKNLFIKKEKKDFMNDF